MTGSSQSSLRDLRIWFGHQSVGQNMLDALAGAPDVGLRILETSDPEALQGPVFAHGRVGQNGDPASKCRAFEGVMRSGVGERVDVAFFKFCYVDITDTTDIGAVLRTYEETMQALAGAYSRVVFLHVTVPLRSVATGPVAWVRDRTGWPDRPRRDKIARHAYNERLRRAYAKSGRLFDLAAIEASRPDGTTSAFRYRGEMIHTLSPEYTADGGHLTPSASDRAARALIQCIVGAVGNRDPATVGAPRRA